MSNTDLDFRCEQFKQSVKYILSRCVRSLELQFYMTHHCNLSCPGCYMAAGPKCDNQYLPSADIEHYVNEFGQFREFKKGVCFSGGEIFTLPMQYLKYNIQSMLDKRIYVELKTNGSWIDNRDRANEIFAMLSGLDVPRRLNATPERIQEFLSTYPSAYLKSLGRDGVNKMLDKRFGVSSLDMALSVDNVIHPAQSADWFIKIADRVTSDAALAKRIDLKTVSISNKGNNFFEQNVLERNNIYAHNIDGDRRLEFVMNDRRIESVFGNFIDSSATYAPENDADIVLHGGRLVLFLYYDRTIGFENTYLQSVGRVPYIDSTGRYKDAATLMREITDKMVADFRQKIQ